LNRRPADYKSAALPTELARHLGKQKMGAWTSAFTIGISNREVSALSTVKGYIPINLNIKTTTHNFS
jgi:hypothetical protein